MSQVFDDIDDAIDHMDDLQSASAFAAAVAIGVWGDDAASPGIVATVYEGKLFSLAIADCYTQLPPDELTTILSVTIIGAFFNWRQDYDRWLQAATENPAVMLDYATSEESEESAADAEG